MKKLGKHKRVIEGAKPFVDYLSKVKDVRVRCGVCKPYLSASSEHMKLDKMSGCIKVTFRTKNALETFFVYGEDSLVNDSIQAFINKNQIQVI